MALYIYETATGRLFSYSQWDDAQIPDQAGTDELASRGYSWKHLEEKLSPTRQWDETTLALKDVPPPYESREIPCSRFILSFTAAELAAVRASLDPVVAQLMLAVQVTPFIDMNRQSTINGVGYLAVAGLIAEARVAEILSTE